MGAKLHIGLRLPAVHGLDMAELRAFVLRAEELEFHSIWVGDHVLYPVDVLQPLHLLTWVAALTSRVRLGTAVMLGAYVHPVLLAKAVSTLDYISDGRLTLGLSVGGSPEEYASLGVPMNERVGRLVESVAIMRQLWQADDVRYAGRYYQVEHASMHPRPVQQPGVPVYFGGNLEATLRRAARHADGWVGSAALSLETFVANVATTRQAAAELGRDPDGLGFAKLHGISVHANPAEARARAARQWHSYYGPRFDVDARTIHGTPETVVARLQPLAAVDAPEVMLIVEPPTLDLAALALLRDVAAGLPGVAGFR